MGPLSAASRAVYARIMFAFRQVALWATTLGLARTLLRFGLANARVLSRYRIRCRRYVRRESQGARGSTGTGFGRKRWMGSLTRTALIEPLVPWSLALGWVALVVRLPAASRLDYGSRRRVQGVFRAVSALQRRPRGLADPLTAPAARELQGTLVRYAFERFLGVWVTADEAEVLARYGTVDRALYDFLRYCGCPDRVPAHDALQLHLPGFVSRTRLRHEAIVRRRRVRSILRSWVRSAGWGLALLRRVRAAAFRVRLAQLDAKERAAARALRRQGHADLWRGVLRHARDTAATERYLGLCVLGAEMHLHALLAITRIGGWLSCLRTDDPSGSYSRFHRLAERHAVRQLQRNFTALKLSLLEATDVRR